MRKTGKYIVAFGLLGAVCAVLLPTLLSTSFALNVILKKINTRAPGTLTVHHCSFSWLDETTCEGIAYDDGGQELRVARGTINKGLWKLLFDRQNMGTIRVVQPTLTLVRQAGESTPSVVEGRPGHADPAGAEKAAEAEQGTGGSQQKPFWERMNVRMLIEDGTLRIDDGGDAPQTAFQQTRLSVELTQGEMRLETAMVDGDGKGTLNASGFVNLPPRTEQLAAALVAEIDVQSQDFQLAPFFLYAAGSANLPTGQAAMSADVKINASGLDTMAMAGLVKLSDVALGGGFLGADRPEFEYLRLVVNGQKKGQEWSFQRLDLDGDSVSMQVNGEYGPNGRDFTARGNVSLAELSHQMPHLLRIHGETTLHSGTIGFSVDLHEKGDRLAVKARAEAMHLSGEHNNQLFAWRVPFQINVQAEKNGADVQLDSLNITAPFGSVTASGNPRSFSLQATADLQQTFQELGQIFALPWQATGQLDVNGFSLELPEDRYGINLNLDIADFSLLHEGQLLLPKHHGKLLAKIQAPGTGLVNGATLDGDLVVSSWPGTIKIKMHDAGMRGNQPRASYQVDADLALGRLTDLLHGLAILPRETTATGRMTLQNSGSLENNVLSVRQIDAVIEDLVFLQGGKVIRDPRVRWYMQGPAMEEGIPVAVHQLAIRESFTDYRQKGLGQSTVDFGNKQVLFRNLVLETTAARIIIHDLAMTDWRKPVESVSTWIDGDVSLASLSDILHDHAILSDKLALDGTARVVVQAGQRTDKGQVVDLRVQADNFSLSQDGQQLLVDEKVDGALLLDGRLIDGDVRLKELSLNSQPLQVTAAGIVTQGEVPTLTLSESRMVYTSDPGRQLITQGLLGRVQPLLGVFSRPSGTVQVDLNRFSWPLKTGGSEQAEFEAVFDLSKVEELESSGVLREALTTFALQDDPLMIQDEPMTCRAKEGRVLCSPVTLLVDQAEMVVIGSVGMDGTLDYLFALPVTEKLVGPEGYRVLGETTIRVLVQGTIDEPLLRQEMMVSAVDNIMQQAAKKSSNRQINIGQPKLLEGVTFE